jgi:hypothetical protein
MPACLHACLWQLQDVARAGSQGPMHAAIGSMGQRPMVMCVSAASAALQGQARGMLLSQVAALIPCITSNEPHCGRVRNLEQAEQVVVEGLELLLLLCSSCGGMLQQRRVKQRQRWHQGRQACADPGSLGLAVHDCFCCFRCCLKQPCDSLRQTSGSVGDEACWSTGGMV